MDCLDLVWGIWYIVQLSGSYWHIYMPRVHLQYRSSLSIDIYKKTNICANRTINSVVSISIVSEPIRKKKGEKTEVHTAARFECSG